jgi:hypothetical protein
VYVSPHGFLVRVAADACDDVARGSFDTLGPPEQAIDEPWRGGAGGFADE